MEVYIVLSYAGDFWWPSEVYKDRQDAIEFIKECQENIQYRNYKFKIIEKTAW